MNSKETGDRDRTEFEYYTARRNSITALLRRADAIPMGTLSVGDFKYISSINPQWACYDVLGNEGKYWTAHVFLSRLLKAREL